MVVDGDCWRVRHRAPAETAATRRVKYVKRRRNLNQRLLDKLYLLGILDLSGEAEMSSAEVQLIEE